MFFAAASSHADGLLRHALDLPHLERAAERVLRDVLGEREVVHAEDAHQRGHEPAGLVAEEVRIERGVARAAHIAMVGRTSTAPPTSKMGQPRASSTAWSMFFASTIE